MLGKQASLPLGGARDFKASLFLDYLMVTVCAVGYLVNLKKALVEAPVLARLSLTLMATSFWTLMQVPMGLELYYLKSSMVKRRWWHTSVVPQVQVHG